MDLQRYYGPSGSLGRAPIVSSVFGLNQSNYVGGENNAPDSNQLARIVLQDAGVSTSNLEDTIVTAALKNPQDFMRARKELMDHLAAESSKAAIEAVKHLSDALASNLAKDYPDVHNSMVRNLATKFYREMIAAVDPMFDNSKSLMLKKMTNT